MKNSKKYYRDHFSCAHAWAHQLSEEGHASNLFFVDNVIYSYGHHFPIASIYGDRVFFTTRNYSRSTSKHKSRVLSSISHQEIIYVYEVPTETVDPKEDTYFINKNVDHWLSVLRRLSIDFDRHKRRTSLLKEISHYLYLLKSFVTALEIMPPAIGQLLENGSFQNMSDYDRIMHRILREEKKKHLKRLDDFSKELKEWHTGNSKELLTAHPDDPNLAYLRFNQHKNTIETSKGIKVPHEEAQKLYRFIKNILDKNLKNFKYTILNFRVNNITGKYLTVGCHKIPMEEIRMIAKQLKWEKGDQ